MAGRFDQALINRERNRQKLAEALEETYQSEERNRKLSRLLVLGTIGIAGFYFGKGALFVAENTKPRGTAPAPSSAKEIIKQMQNQLTRGDPLMIAAETPAQAAERKSRRSKAEKRLKFQEEKVPFRLLEELSKRPGQNHEKKGYNPPKERLAEEINNLKARSTRRTPHQNSMYRPAIASDIPKIPPEERKIKSLAPSNDLYLRLNALPERLKADKASLGDH